MMYTIKNPYKSKILLRKPLSSPASTNKTCHLVLEAKDELLQFLPGDSVALFVQNDPSLVKKILTLFNASGKELILNKRTKQKILFEEFLSTKANITFLSTTCIRFLVSIQSDTAIQEKFHALLTNNEQLIPFLHEHDLVDMLKQLDLCALSPQLLCDRLLPLLPRFYSIASSAHSHPGEIHILVKELVIQINKKKKLGVASHFLCDLAKENITPIPMAIHPSRFHLPDTPNQDIIMIGPGTGIAPFKSFLEERIIKKDKGKNWLFFGERNKAHDFYYQDFLETLVTNKQLTLNTAFSRDQKEKIYVQHLMTKQGSEIYSWLENGAYIYVCGDAKKMAIQVEKTLIEIIKTYKKCHESDALDYLKKLKEEKRYLKDVY